MARSSECKEWHAQKVIDSAGIVRDAMLRQSTTTSRDRLAENSKYLFGAEFFISLGDNAPNLGHSAGQF